MKSIKYAKDIPNDHKCKYCDKSKNEVTFRWVIDRKTKERIKPYSVCIKCMYDIKIKRKYSQRGAIVKKRIDAYFKENY